MLKFSGNFIWRLGSRNIAKNYSSTSATRVLKDKLAAADTMENKSIPNLDKGREEDTNKPGLVAAVFATLNSADTEDTKRPSPKSVKQSRGQQLDLQIVKAIDVNSLLLVAENPVVSRRHALKIVSILSDWSSTSKAKISDFEKDPRFLKLCRILARTTTSQAMTSLSMAEDLSTVLGITGDDEAARLISNLTLPQMVKVMKALHQKGRRSTPLLRALSFNITRQADVIDLKKSADLLYSMVTLNFPDPVLLDRICKDVIECLPSNQDKPAVVTSIMVSLGLLRYRHEPALAAAAGWLQARAPAARAGDVAAAVVTLATLHYEPPHTEQLFQMAENLKEAEMAKSSAWLDLVFALLILDRAKPHHLTSTLQPEFIDKLLLLGEIAIPARRKLMTIDACAALASGGRARAGAEHAAAGAGAEHAAAFAGAEHVAVGVPLLRTRDKALFVHSVLDSFKSLVSADAFLRRDCDSGAGFMYDAEFAVDSKCHPVPLEKAANDNSVFRIAVLCLDYHDMTRKTAVPLGVYQLYSTILRQKGFKVLQIPYTEFNPRDKLVTRVQYIEQRLKQLISDSSLS